MEEILQQILLKYAVTKSTSTTCVSICAVSVFLSSKQNFLTINVIIIEIEGGSRDALFH